MKEIYLAGGCFWGAEKYLQSIPGVAATEVGYANGNTENPSYEQVCRENTGHAETVKVNYDEEQLPLPLLLGLFFDAVDPTSVNRQGGDTGPQYRSGVYYTDPGDRMVIDAFLSELGQRLDAPVAVEVTWLKNYWPAEEYHQNYLDKNPGGYCHISPAQFAKVAATRVNPTAWRRPPTEALRKTLTDEQFEVTQENATEAPFQNEFWDDKRKGIYVDITTGEPLFASADKFDSGCGWPSFTKPLDPFVLRQHQDDSAGMHRTEVRSRVGNAHLGHVFPDGPKDKGGLRYCINSASLRFVPLADMEKEGYGKLRDLVE